MGVPTSAIRQALGGMNARRCFYDRKHVSFSVSDIVWERANVAPKSSSN